jgi:hypothetical protein
MSPLLVFVRRLVLCTALVWAGVVIADDSPEIEAGRKFAARDTLRPQSETTQDAIDCLNHLCWKPSDFEVKIEASDGKNGDWLLRFPSAIASGDAVVDYVAVEWYPAKDKSKKPIFAPAAVIVHESGSGMTVGRLIASALGRKGVHAFMVQLPNYGKRRSPSGKPTGQAIVSALKQGIADVRRTKDAIATLAYVDQSRISLQGTSLGGFVASTTAGLDQGFHRIFLLLSGGDIHSVVMNGKKDASKMREELEQNGESPEQIKDRLQSIEPLRLAHRIDPNKTWLFSGEFDDVVPLANANLLARKIPLAPSHHIVMPADHYSGILMMPTIVQQMYDRMIEP